MVEGRDGRQLWPVVQPLNVVQPVVRINEEDTINFGILTWDFEEPSNAVDFLDLSIENCRLVTRTSNYAIF